MLLAADGAATEMRQLPDGIFTMLPLTMLATLIVHTLVGRPRGHGARSTCWYRCC